MFVLSIINQYIYIMSKKQNLDLLNLHKILCNNFLNTETQIPHFQKQQILRVYDNYIDNDNIRLYYNANILTFIKALITDNLNQIAKFHSQPKTSTSC